MKLPKIFGKKFVVRVQISNHSILKQMSHIPALSPKSFIRVEIFDNRDEAKIFLDNMRKAGWQENYIQDTTVSTFSLKNFILRPWHIFQRAMNTQTHHTSKAFQR